MRPLRDLRIRQKLLAITLVTTAVSLLVAGAGIVIADSLLFRSTMQRDLAALAKIIGDNSTAALAFDDPRTATQMLAALQARPHMVSACIYRPDGTLFARYSQSGSAAECRAPAAGEAIRFTTQGLTDSHPILLDNRQIGTLVLFLDSGAAVERVRVYVAIVVIILLGSSVVAFLLSSKLRDLIAAPMTRLAQAAESVSKTGDYCIRVEKDSGDEVGVLVDGFNQMLERVHDREVEIQTARNSLQTTLSSIGDAVISTDKNGRIVFANPVARSLLRPAQELEGRHIDEVFRIVNEFTREKVENPIQRVLQEGVIVGLANHTILIAGDGTEIPIDDSAAPIKQGGRIAGVVLVFRDITERRRGQQDAAYLAAIVESSDDAIVGKSPDGVIRTWNAGAERLYGYTAAEAVGRPMRDLLPPDRQHEESDILERLRDGSPALRFESMRMRKDGTVINVALMISPIRDKVGQIIGVSHIAHDITEQKRIAEQMQQTQKLESLGVLAGGIAHDFNNLLTGILGNASLAMGDLPPLSRARDTVQSVIDASERAAQLVQQMLAYSGKGHFVLERIDLAARIRETLRLIRSSIPPTVALQLDLEESVPAVEADVAQIQQLMMNIIVNGAEAVPDGMPGTLRITVRREWVEGGHPATPGSGGEELAPGMYVLFEVADTGSGMDADTKARIFDPFFTTKFTGRGLGLAAVLGIVRGHRGSIQVASTPGMGTTFSVLLPAAESGREKRVPAQEPQTADANGGGVVLVVDDEPIVRTLAKHALERFGYTVLVAEDGARGLDVFCTEADRLSCVVLDLTMPIMSGEETLVRMKAARADIPIVLSSGFNEAQAVRRFAGKGLAGFLQKPYKAAVLMETIRRVVARSDAAGGGR
jgi:PAS domain S-box-containing protein